MILLFISLIIGVIIWYHIFKGEILSVTVIAHLMYLFSSGILIVFSNYVNYQISIETLVVITGTLLFMGFGEWIARVYMRPKINSYSSWKDTHYFIKPNIYFLSVLVFCVVTLLSYQRFDLIGTYLGGSNFIEKYGLVRGVEVASTQGDNLLSINYPHQRILIYLTFVSEALLYYYSFLLVNAFLSHQKNKFHFLFPILLALPILVLSTERSIFIKFLSNFFIIYFILFRQKNCWKKGFRYNKKILRTGVLIVGAFFVLFGLLGLLKGQNILEAPAEIICSYAGASIIGLDQYLSNHIMPHSEYFGQVSFYGIYQILNKIGFNFAPPPYHQEFFFWNFGHGASNIYCAPYYQLRDFSFLFVLILYLFIGVIYGKLFNSIVSHKNNRHGSVIITMAAYLFYPIVMISITDAFRHLLSMKTIYIFVVLILFAKYGTKIDES